MTPKYLVLWPDDDSIPDEIRELAPSYICFERDHITYLFSGGMKEDAPAIIVYRPGSSTKSSERVYVVP